MIKKFSKTLPCNRGGVFLYKKANISQPNDMKVKVCDTEIRKMDEREIFCPEVDRKGGGTR